MSRHMILLCSTLLVLLANGAWARDALWKTASTVATCETYDRLQQSLENFDYRCQRVAPPFHAELIGKDWLRPAGLSACYVGSMDHVLPIGPAYKCSTFWDRLGFREVLCTREYPEGQVAYEQSALSEWRASLMKSARALKSCRFGAIEFSFTGGSTVPHMLWDHYEHELGLALSSGKSLMYLGTGASKPCGTPGGGEKTEMGVLGFFINANETMVEDPMFWEKHREVGKGLRPTEGGLRDLADIRNRLGPQFSGANLPPGLSIQLGSVGMSAEPHISTDNFEMLRAFRDIEFLSIFESALIDVELDFGFDEEFLDLEEYYEETAHLHPVLRSLACRSSGGEYYEPGKKAFREARIFIGIGTAGCRGGRVLLLTIPTLTGNGLNPEMLFVFVGEHCRDLLKIRRSVTSVFAEVLVDEVLFELGEE